MRTSTISAILATIFLFFVTLCHAGEESRLVANLELGKQQTVITYGTSLTAGGAWIQQLQAILDSSYCLWKWLLLGSYSESYDSDLEDV